MLGAYCFTNTGSMFFSIFFFFDVFSIFLRYFLSINCPFYILSYSMYCRLDISSFRCVDVWRFVFRCLVMDPFFSTLVKQHKVRFAKSPCTLIIYL